MGRWHKRRRSRGGGRTSGLFAVTILLALFFFSYRNIVAILFLALVLAVVVGFILHDRRYKKTAYYKVTGRSYFSVLWDVGLYGEYLTYKRLQHMEEIGARFLFNVYIPKENGETSEIDVLMICPKGLVVFESKNYSGWIFGSEYQTNWYQTLPSGRKKSHKEHFYNPVLQNRGHLKHLATLLDNQIPMHSVIVFSERCTLKNVQMTSVDIPVINRQDVDAVVRNIFAQMPGDVLDTDRITEIYDLLYPFTQVDANTKVQHIDNIKKRTYMKKTKSAPPADEPIAISKTASPIIEIPPEAATEPIEKKVVDLPRQSFKCPRCNGNLVLRTATKGANAGNSFYGCSNFPRCRYVKNITLCDER